MRLTLHQGTVLHNYRDRKFPDIFKFFERIRIAAAIGLFVVA
jgi:hypothetical protein